MSKAEDLAKEFLKKLVSHTTLYEGTIDELEVYEPNDVIWAYKEGYHQAEKDFELTVDDIKTIDRLLNQCVDYSNPCQEVLKRFKETKKVD